MFLTYDSFSTTAGRQEQIKYYVDTAVAPHFVEFATYIGNLPGMKALSVEDQHSLLKRMRYF